MGVFQNNLMGAAAAAASAGGGDFYDYQIANSYRSMTGVGYFSRTPSSAGNRKTYTISFWVKRHFPTTSDFDVICNAQESSTTNYTDSIRFSSTGNLQIAFKGTLSGNLVTTRVFRDTSAWMHIVCAVDTEQGTAADRVKLYINGVQETDFSTETYPAEDYEGGWCNDREHALGRFTGASYTTIGNFYMANFALVDGSQLAPTSFGTSKNGVWIPDDLSGLTWGTTGTWVRFESSSDLGNDSSGNNNDWTNNSVATHDQMTDTPTFNSDSNGGNFATYNPLTKGSYTDLSEGNCRADSNTGADASYPSGNFGMVSGKWYYEQLIGNTSGSYPSTFLVALNNLGYDNTRGTFYAMRYQSSSGAAEQNSGDNIAPFGTITVNTTGVTTAGTGDIVSWYVDMDNKKAWFAKNGTIPNSGDPANGTNPQFSWTENPHGGVTFGSQEYQTSFTTVNAGQDGTFAGEKTAQGNSDDTGYGNFYYDPPTGFLALCAGNLPVADEIDPAQTDDDYPQKLHNPIIWTGNGGTLNVTGLGYQPDLVWYKRRDSSSSHILMDSTRGTSKAIESNNNGSQDTSFTSGITAFGTDGFTLGNQSQGNASGGTYVGWSWRANGGSTSSGSGDLTSTHQVDPSGGFSIVTAVGDGGSGDKTVTHGLSAAPDCILSKNLDTSYNWDTYWSSGMTVTKGLRLNTNEGQQTGRWGTINSSIITCKENYTWVGTNNYIYYCFRNIDGYIKVGNYEGNGSSSDGSFVYTGFKPAFVMGKGVVSGAAWWIQDDATSPYNPSPGVQEPNDAGAMYTSANPNVDFLSNGFKVRNNNAMFNSTSYDPYVFLAVAHNPFKYATAR